ncbi:hypothetical protein [Actinoplanes sp. DH11]|uniref:hypothetical protein n=1 Tax=Actinoplanes sp. DH11 TaxID=2857011 RepID=UPI001E454E0A|nr:hypothetical protein [Actinoplanes sp. DH11]
MKLGFPPNYYVRVSSRTWSLPPDEATPYDGTWTVDLNRVVGVAFVDDLTGLGPPWTAAPLPPPGTALRDPAQIRLAMLLNGDYVVTPNDTLAGRSERFERPWGDPDERDGAVFYTGTADFAALRTDLEDLGDLAGGVHSVARRDELLTHPAIRYIEDHVLTSPWLRPTHARALGRLAD